jgi:zinc transport system ATP-binding protein
MRKTAVHIENLSVYYGETPAITNICMDVEEGEFLGIIGPNGGGKSTLLKSILGLIPITAGSIKIYNEELGKNNTMTGYVPQFATMDKHFPISCLEVVLTGCIKRGISPFFRFTKKHRDIAFEQLERVGIKNLQTSKYVNYRGENFKKCLLQEHSL